MKIELAVIVAALLAAAPAGAQGTFSPGQKPGSTFGSKASSSSTKPKTYVPPTPLAPATKPRTYGAPEAPKAPGFEPYKPFTGSSVYARPSGAAAGAKPCETSVYTNACGKTR